MKINWDNIKLEGDAAKALELLKGTTAFTSYVDDAVTNREDAARQTVQSEADKHKAKVDEFRQTNIDLKEKLEKLDLSEEDIAEYERLKKLGSESGAAAEKLKALELEYEGKITAKDKEISTLKEEKTGLETRNNDNSFKFDVHKAIGEFHMDDKNKVKVADGAEATLIEKAMASRKLVDGKVVMLQSDGKEFTTDKGIGSVKEWISEVGRQAYPFLFQSPSGSGASGDTSSGAGDKTISRADFDAMTDPAKKSEVARSHTITD